MAPPAPPVEQFEKSVSLHIIPAFKTWRATPSRLQYESTKLEISTKSSTATLFFWINSKQLSADELSNSIILIKGGFVGSTGDSEISTGVSVVTTG